VDQRPWTSTRCSTNSKAHERDAHRAARRRRRRNAHALARRPARVRLRQRLPPSIGDDAALALAPEAGSLPVPGERRAAVATPASLARWLGICGGGHRRRGTPEYAHRPVLDGGCTVQRVSELRLRRHAPGRSSGAGATYVGMSAQHSTRTYAPRLGAGPRRRPRHTTPGANARGHHEDLAGPAWTPKRAENGTLLEPRRGPERQNPCDLQGFCEVVAIGSHSARTRACDARQAGCNRNPRPTTLGRACQSRAYAIANSRMTIASVSRRLTTVEARLRSAQDP
jgi:hypothetical protein